MTISVDKINETYPFLSIIRINKEEKVGIIQNCDQKIISMYCYDSVPRDLQSMFLEYGKNWWWESNRKLPINMFLGKQFAIFTDALRSYSLKETEILHGPVTRLSDLLANKKIRRKTVQLLRKV